MVHPLSIIGIEDIDQFARDLAHTLCAAECFAFTGSETKPHSAQCQRTAKIIADALRKVPEE